MRYIGTKHVPRPAIDIKIYIWESMTWKLDNNTKNATIAENTTWGFVIGILE